jgi:hypothetical protein
VLTLASIKHACLDRAREIEKERERGRESERKRERESMVPGKRKRGRLVKRVCASRKCVHALNVDTDTNTA